MLNVRRLLLLTEAAERGSLTAAAEELGMTTSAASQQMSLLEQEAGQPLVERLPRGIRPTPRAPRWRSGAARYAVSCAPPRPT